MNKTNAIKILKIIFPIFLLIFLLFFIYFKIHKPKEVIFKYNIFGCNEKREEEKVISYGNVEIKAFNDSIFLTHNLTYSCCAEIHAYFEIIEKQNFKIIKIKEKNEKEVCRCLCNYIINMSILNLDKGLYRVEIWGIEFDDNPGEILFEKYVSIS
jgi:hypothetical protein